MREIKRIFIHCSATPPSMDIDADTIREWHKERGWSDIGYHHVIRRDGIIETGRDPKKIGAHVKGHNSDSLGICLVGGVAEDGRTPEANFTDEQMRSLSQFLKIMKHALGLTNADIYGHRDAPGVAKACPSFDVAHWLETGEVNK